VSRSFYSFTLLLFYSFTIRRNRLDKDDKSFSILDRILILLGMLPSSRFTGFLSPVFSILHKALAMTKPFYILLLALTCIAFTNTDCKKNECPTCPSPPEPDSTSHYYSWQIDTIGTWQSFASGVWGTSSNNVYVVGSFYNPDYNPDDITHGTSIIHWDGTQWNPTSFWVGDLYCIFGFNANDVWVGGNNGVNPIIGHWNGSSWEKNGTSFLNNFTFIGIQKIWGTSSSNLYAVGGNGTILHYDGTVWTSMTSNTVLTLIDIWGFNPNSIYAAGLDISTGTGVLLFYNGSQWNKLYERNYTTPVEPYGSTGAVWGYDTSHVYIATGYGSYLGNRWGWSRLNDIPAPVWIEAIKGESYKNIFFVGDFGLVIHWNGKSWYRYDQFYAYSQGGGDILYGAWAKGNSVFVVGRSQSAQGIIYRGTQ
jgi:hypothetical protein